MSNWVAYNRLLTSRKSVKKSIIVDCNLIFANAGGHANWGLFSCAKDRMREKTCERRTENKISRKSISKKKQLPFN